METPEMDETDIINEELKTAIHKLKKTKETRWGIIKEKFFEKYENCSEEEESDVDGFEKFLAAKENIPPKRPIKVGTKKSNNGAWYEQEFIAPELKDYHEEAERLRDEIENKIKTLNLIVGKTSIINQEISKSGSTESADSIDNNSVDNIPAEISKSDSTNGAALIDADRIKNSTANLPVEIQKPAPRSEAPLIDIDKCKDSAVNLAADIQKSDSTTETTLVETNKSPNLGLVMPSKKQVQKGNKKPLTRSQNNNRGKGASSSTKGRTKNKQKPQNSNDESLSDSSTEIEVKQRNVQDEELEAAINKLHQIKMRRWALIKQKFCDKYEKNSSEKCGNGHRKYELMGQEADLVFIADDLVSYHEEANNLRDFIEQKILTLKPYQAKLKSKKKAQKLAELQSKNTMEKIVSATLEFQEKCSLEDNRNVPKMKNKSQSSRVCKENSVIVKEITSPPQSLRAGSSSPSLCSLVQPGPVNSPKKAVKHESHSNITSQTSDVKKKEPFSRSTIEDEKIQTDDSDINLPLQTQKKQKSLVKNASVKNSRLQKFQKHQSVSNAKTIPNTDCEEMAELESVDENHSTNGILSFSAACTEGDSKRNLQNESNASEDDSSTTAISSSDVNFQSRNPFSKHRPSQNAETYQRERNDTKLLYFNKRKRGKEASPELFKDETDSEDHDLPEVFSNCTTDSNEKLSSSCSSTINGFNGLEINDESSCDSLSTENVQGNHPTALPITKSKRICLENQALPSSKKCLLDRTLTNRLNAYMLQNGYKTSYKSVVDWDEFRSLYSSSSTSSPIPISYYRSFKFQDLQKKEKCQFPGRNRSASNPSPKKHQSLRVSDRFKKCLLDQILTITLNANTLRMGYESSCESVVDCDECSSTYSSSASSSPTPNLSNFVRFVDLPNSENPGQNSLPRTEGYTEKVPQEIACDSITVENSSVDEELHASSPSFRTTSRFPNQKFHSDQVFLKSPNLQRKEKYQSIGRSRSASNPSPKNYQSLKVSPRKEQYECHPDSMVVNDGNKLGFIERPNSAAHLPSPRKRQPLMLSPNHPALQKKKHQPERNLVNRSISSDDENKAADSVVNSPSPRKNPTPKASTKDQHSQKAGQGPENTNSSHDENEAANSVAPSPRKVVAPTPKTSPKYQSCRTSERIKRLQMERKPTSSFSDPEMSESISSLDPVNSNLQRGSPTKKQKSERDSRVKRLLEEDKLSSGNSNRHSPRLDTSLQNPRIIKNVDVKFLSFQEEPDRPVCNLHLSVNKKRRSTISLSRGGHSLQRTLSASSRLDLPVDDLVRPRK